MQFKNKITNAGYSRQLILYKRQRKPKRLPRINISEIHATLDTRHQTKNKQYQANKQTNKQTKTKTHNTENQNPTKKPGLMYFSGKQNKKMRD